MAFFSLHLVYLSTAACISEKKKTKTKTKTKQNKTIFGSMLAEGSLRSKIKHKSQNVTFCELTQ